MAERPSPRSVVATRLEISDVDHARLRTIVAMIGGALGTDDGNGREAITASWDELTTLLALRPAPELRACPGCGEMAMLAATVCGGCWRKLPPAALGGAD